MNSLSFRLQTPLNKLKKQTKHSTKRKGTHGQKHILDFDAICESLSDICHISVKTENLKKLSGNNKYYKK